MVALGPLSVALEKAKAEEPAMMVIVANVLIITFFICLSSL
jgi:hypothetical protein